mmetsp:Transcript_24284/g.17099  ORF Transcript_24284/g.17099 Transcript_24284/m.17099 type:complete len:109 (-) Transcript_24284:312-638(-)
MLIGSCTMAIMNISVKYVHLLTPVSVFELCYFRGIAMFIGSQVHAWSYQINPINIPKSSAKWLFMRAMFGVLSFVCQFVGIYLLPFSTAIVLYFTQPIFASLISYFLN